MKKYTVLFLDRTLASHKVAIINRWTSKDGYFRGWYANTLKQAYKYMLKNPKGKWNSELPGGFNNAGCWYHTDKNTGLEMLYEIPKEQLLTLIKMEELLGEL